MLLLLCAGHVVGAQQDVLAAEHAPARFAALDAHGRLVTSDRPVPGMRRFSPHAHWRRKASPGASHHPSVDAWAQRSAHWSPLIERVATEAGLDPALVHAVIRVESGYDSSATSPAGAYGLMQVMPATAARFGVHDLKEPRENLRAGAAYLAWLLRRFDGDHALALAAYNAGEGSVIRHGNTIPPYVETQAYVARLRTLYRFP